MRLNCYSPTSFETYKRGTLRHWQRYSTQDVASRISNFQGDKPKFTVSQRCCEAQNQWPKILTDQRQECAAPRKISGEGAKAKNPKNPNNLEDERQFSLFPILQNIAPVISAFKELARQKVANFGSAWMKIAARGGCFIPDL